MTPTHVALIAAAVHIFAYVAVILIAWGKFDRRMMNVEGSITQMKVDKPSEVLAAMNIPLDIVKAVVALPTELIQFKMNYSSENKKLYDALLQEIQAKDALIDYLKEREGKGKAKGK